MTANFYQSLLRAVPLGPYYASNGEVLPVRDTPYEFRFETSLALRRFGLFVNGVYQTLVTTDAAGVAIVRVLLEKGEQLIELVDETNQRRARAQVTLRDYATWMAAHADALEVVETALASTRAALSILTVDGTFIDDVYGARVGQPNDVSYVLDAYRNVVQELRQAYRLWGARPAGLRQAVGALTGVSPFLVPRALKAQFVLDDQLAGNEPTTALFNDDTFPLLNAHAHDFVQAAFANNISPLPGPFTDPPIAQPLTVTFDAAWLADGAAGNVLITGLDEAGLVISDVFLKAGSTAGVPRAGQTGQRFATPTAIRLDALGAGVGTATIGLAESRFITFVSASGPWTRDGVATAHTLKFWEAAPAYNYLQLNDVSVDLAHTGRYTLYGAFGYALASAPIARLPGILPTTANVAYATRDRLWLRIDHMGPVKVILGASARSHANIVVDINAAIAREENFGATRAIGTITITSYALINEADTVTIVNALGASVVFEADTDDTVTAGQIPFNRLTSNTAVRDALMARINGAGMLILALPTSTTVITLYSELAGTDGNQTITLSGLGISKTNLAGGANASATYLTRAALITDGAGNHTIEVIGSEDTFGEANAAQLDPHPVDGTLDIFGFPRAHSSLSGAESIGDVAVTCAATSSFPLLPAIVLHASAASSVLQAPGAFTNPDWPAPVEVWFSPDWDGGDITVDGTDRAGVALQERFAYPGEAVIDSDDGTARHASSYDTLSTLLIGAADGAGAEVRIWNAAVPGVAGDATTVFVLDPGTNNAPLTAVYDIGTDELTITLATDGSGTITSTGQTVAAAIEASTAFLAVPTGTGATVWTVASLDAVGTVLASGLDGDGMTVMLTRAGPGFVATVRPGMLFRIVGGAQDGETRRILAARTAIYEGSFGSGSDFSSFPPVAYCQLKGAAYAQQGVALRLDAAINPSAYLGWEVLDAVVVKGAEVFFTVTAMSNSDAGAGLPARWQLRIRDGVETYGIPARIGRGLRTTGTDGVVVAPQTARGDITSFTSATYVPHADDFGGILRISGSVVWGGCNNGLHEVYRLDPQLMSNILSGTLFLQHEWRDKAGRFELSPVSATSWASFIPDDGAYGGGAALAWSMYSAGESVLVIGNNRGTGVLALAEPGLMNTKWSGALVEVSADMPVRRTGLPAGLNALTIDIDRTVAPAVTTTQTLTAQARVVPDGWRLYNIDESACLVGVFGHTSNLRLRLEADGGTTYGGDGIALGPMIVELQVPRALDYRGFTLRADFWMEQLYATAGASFLVVASFDEGRTWTSAAAESVPFSVTDSGTAGYGGTNPTCVSGSFVVPADAVGCRIWLRSNAAGAAGRRIFLEQAIVVATQGVFLESNTPLRHETHGAFGELLYVWSPQALTLAERTGLGVPDPATRDAIVTRAGHIDSVSNAHGYWERVDVSEYDSGGLPLNIVGAYDETDWLAATLTNMEVVPLVPGRLSYVRPTMPSMVRCAQLAIIAPSNAPLPAVPATTGPYPQAPGPDDRLFEGGTTTVIAAFTAASSEDGLAVEAELAFSTALPGDIFQLASGASSRVLRRLADGQLVLAQALAPFGAQTGQVLRRTGALPVPSVSFPGTRATATIGAGADGTVTITALEDGLGPHGFDVQVNADLGADRPLAATFEADLLLVELAARDGSLLTNENRALFVASAIAALGSFSAEASGTGVTALAAAAGPTAFAGGQATPWRFVSPGGDPGAVQLASVAAGDGADTAYYAEGVNPAAGSTPVYAPASAYTLDYAALIQATAVAYDLGADFADYVWLIDASIYQRVEPELFEAARSEPLIFRADFTAELPEAAVADQTRATLRQDNGVVRDDVPTANWRFVTPTRVAVDAGQFDPDAIYTLDFVATPARFPRVATVVLEVRTAAAAVDVAAAVWRVAALDMPIDQRYGQLRVTLTNVADARDVRIKSLGLRGLNVYGDPTNVPGIIPLGE